jgi:N-acetylneuraminate synthase/sialic acid synthase
MLKSTKNAAYIIAEVGQNHQGDFELAKKYIRSFADAGADAVKFQKRDMPTLFTPEALAKPYESENAFADTYGEHRDYLELSMEQMEELKNECDKVGVDFMCTPFDLVSLDNLASISTDVIKVASFDMGNLPFLKKIIDSGIEFVISCGGSNKTIVDKTIEFLLSYNAKFTLLHCVSRYPCTPSELTLGRISLLKEKYPTLQIGLSDHFNGILSGALGYQLGAEVFEKHVTFDRSLKGTDHGFALSLHGFQSFVRDINRTELMIQSELPADVGTEAVFKKLGKKIEAATDIAKGEVISLEHLTSRITPDGIPVRSCIDVIGYVAKRDYQKGEFIDESQL